jgi:hypothetical protein
MSLVVPDAVEVIILQLLLNTPLTLRLFGNNATPGPASTAASFNEIAGGGYANKPLTFAGWSFTPNAPSFGLYAKQSWTFTGVINAPGTLYGYYVTRNSDGILLWAERFAPGVVPFTPILNSLVEVTPKFTGSSVF